MEDIDNTANDCIPFSSCAGTVYLFFQINNQTILDVSNIFSLVDNESYVDYEMSICAPASRCAGMYTRLHLDLHNKVFTSYYDSNAFNQVTTQKERMLQEAHVLKVLYKYF